MSLKREVLIVEIKKKLLDIVRDALTVGRKYSWGENQV
jgi:hypothetical protein